MQEYVATLSDKERAAYQREIDRIESGWAKEFKAGRMTPLAYYRRLRRLPLDYLSFRTGIDIPELFVLDDGPRLPSLDQAQRLAALLGVEPSQLTQP